MPESSEVKHKARWCITRYTVSAIAHQFAGKEGGRKLSDMTAQYVEEYKC